MNAKFWVAEFEGKRPHGRPSHRWEDNTGIYVKGKRSVKCGLDSSGSG